MCSAWFRTFASVRTCRIGAVFYDSAGNLLSTVYSVNTASDSAAAWTPVAGPVTAPASSAFARLSAQVQATGAGAEVHYVDDAQLAPGAAYSGGNGAAASTTGGGGARRPVTTRLRAAGSGVTAAPPVRRRQRGNGGAAGANNGVNGSALRCWWRLVSTGAAQTGGNGANGKVAVTYTPPLSAFKTLIAHAPSFTAPATLNPLIPVGSGLDTPNGATEYSVTSPTPGLNARFYGTYTILAVASTVNSPGSARTLTIGFKQYDYVGGPSSTLSVARTLTPSTETPPIANGLIIVGEVTLPVRDLAPDQTSAFTTVTVTDQHQ
jgi:hypothetical protein